MKKTTINDVDVDEFEKLAGLLTAEQIGKFYGVHRKTLFAWMTRRADLRMAFDMGHAKRTAMVANCLMKNIQNGDTASIIFYLKTRAGWSEKVQDAETELLKQQAKLTKASVEEARAELKRLGIHIPEYSKEDPPVCPQKTH